MFCQVNGFDPVGASGVINFVTAVVVGVAAGVGVDGFTTATPVFQTSFLPDLVQVNFTFATVEVAPALVQVAPDLTLAAPAWVGIRLEASRTNVKRIELLRMPKNFTKIEKLLLTFRE
jgi:hypothetical protein